MIPSLEALVLTLYYLVLGILALYGIHRAYLVILYLRHRKNGPRLPEEPESWPRVTVQLPLYNERYVARRLIEAVCRLDYPCDRLEIQVLDDSTDDTRDLVASLVEDYRDQGIDIVHLHREDRKGFKAGALAEGVAVAKGNLLAVFDADFVPGEDFLRRTIPHFSDPEIGMVQAAWEHLNRDYSLLTKVQAIFLDGHFRIEHLARNRSGLFFNFNGTAGIWRRKAIEDAGGWQHDTLTEDLDLSYRSQLAGWRFLFLPEVRVPAELPVDVKGFKSQQFRWARGSVQTARKLLGRILRSPLPWRQKFEAFVHLTNNGCYLLMVALALLVVPAMILRADGGAWQLLTIDLPFFLAATVSVLIFYYLSQRDIGRSPARSLVLLPALMSLGMGLAVNNCRAVVRGLSREAGTFHRTPKYQIESSGDAWKQKTYRVTRAPGVLTEGAFSLYFLFGTLLTANLGFWPSLPFLWLFLQGYSYMFFLGAFPRLSEIFAKGPTPIEA